MKILLLNHAWFADELRAAGHEVVAVGTLWPLEHQIESALIHIDTLIQSLPNGFSPDRIVVLDNSAPLLVSGLEECSIPCVFLAVDVHHHTAQYRYTAHLFDHTFVAQRDYIGHFAAMGVTPEWMPLWASSVVSPSTEKQFGALFVGTLNPELNPDRVRFFDELQKCVPIQVMSGDWHQLFPQSELVVNQTVKGDLNFRVFEAMVSGPALLTESSGNGLSEIFVADEHLVLYEKGNVEQAAAQISSLLSNLPRCREIAAAGRAEVLAKHLPKHRADRLLEVLTALTRTHRPLRFFGAMGNYINLARRVESMDGFAFTKAMSCALKSAEQGLQAEEPLTEELSCLLLVTALHYDRTFGSNSGKRLLETLSEAYPQLLALKLGRIRSLLNRGERELAETLALTFGSSPEVVFMSADELVMRLSEELWTTDKPLVTRT